MSLDLHPDSEHQVVVRAHAAGITANDYSARLLAAASPTALSDVVERVRGLLHDWQQQDPTPTEAPAPNDGTLTPSEALFRQWKQQDANLT